MKHLLFTLLFAYSAAADDRTFEQLTAAFPLGTTKQDILKAEPTAKVTPSMATPLDLSARRENVTLVDVDKDSPLACQFYLINDRLAAIMLARAFRAAAPEENKELNFISSQKKLSEFIALRAAKDLDPIEVKVAQYSTREPNQVALTLSTPIGPELWIVDERIFDPKSFFMMSTKENRDKLLKSKGSIDQKIEIGTK